VRAISYLNPPCATDYAYARGHLKLEIDDLERRAINRSLAERRSRLIEKVEDTTQQQLSPYRRDGRQLAQNSPAVERASAPEINTLSERSPPSRGRSSSSRPTGA
jgi:hypothetical protein